MARKKLFMIFVTLMTAICLAMAGVTVAYFQQQTETKVNAFELGSVDVHIKEVFPKPNGIYAIKTVALQNTGTVDAYLRAMIVPVFRTGDNSLACNVDYSNVGSGYIHVTTLDGNRTFKLILANGWNNGWEFSSENNAFFFRAKVPPGKLTTELLAGVETNSGDWENLNIDVLADAVQTEGDTVLQFLKDRWGIHSIDPAGTLIW